MSQSSEALASDKKESHFIDTLSAKREIPRGVELADIAPLLENRVVLREDSEARPFDRSNGLTGFFTIRPIRKGAIVYQGDVSSTPDSDLGARLPPHHRLETILLTSDFYPALELCGQYDRAVLETIEEGGGKTLLEANVRLIGYSSPGSDKSPLVVSLAVPTTSSLGIGPLFEQGGGDPDSPFSRVSPTQETRKFSVRCVRGVEDTY